MKAGIYGYIQQLSLVFFITTSAPIYAESNILAIAPNKPNQVMSSSSELNAGLTVKGSSTTGTLTIGSGFTVSCPDREVDHVPAESEIFYYSPAELFNPPPNSSGTYKIRNFNDYNENLNIECKFRYSARTSDAAAQSTGQGADFTLSGGGNQRASLHHVIIFEMYTGNCPSDDNDEEEDEEVEEGEGCPGDDNSSPIIIDLDKDGVHLGHRNIGVFFDIDADGHMEHIQWTSPDGDEAFLFIDHNGNGVVDDGSELFGNATLMPIEGDRAPNGFVALADYDNPIIGGNDDGKITVADNVWWQLLLWHDRNADGVSSPDETLSLQTTGITSLETIPKTNNKHDSAGNWLPFWAWAKSTGKPEKMKMVDVFFRIVD